MTSRCWHSKRLEFSFLLSLWVLLRWPHQLHWLKNHRGKYPWGFPYVTKLTSLLRLRFTLSCPLNFYLLLSVFQALRHNTYNWSCHLINMQYSVLFLMLPFHEMVCVPKGSFQNETWRVHIASYLTFTHHSQLIYNLHHFLPFLVSETHSVSSPLQQPWRPLTTSIRPNLQPVLTDIFLLSSSSANHSPHCWEIHLYQKEMWCTSMVPNDP